MVTGQSQAGALARRPTVRCLLACACFLVFALVFLLPCIARAADHGLLTCDGPDACCPAKVEFADNASHVVRVGVVLVGIYEVSEKTSSWMADFYLYESWRPAPGFVPQTEVVNEIERKSVQFDNTEFRDGQCSRSRRIHSALRTAFNLRTFPFDQQTLVLELSDAEFPTRQVRYDEQATAGLDDAATRQLAAWKVLPGLRYEHSTRAFRWDPGAPDYDYATFSVTVRRHISFHLSRYFLPLLLIVIVSFGVFWINPEDLSSEVQVAVTCLLAAVALQLSEGRELPDVSYLTIADRAFAASYVAIALSIIQVLYTNHLSRAGKKERALRLDRWSRVVFPAALVLALAAAVVRAYTQTE
jgi:hypothetical protein